MVVVRPTFLVIAVVVAGVSLVGCRPSGTSDTRSENASADANRRTRPAASRMSQSIEPAPRAAADQAAVKQEPASEDAPLPRIDAPPPAQSPRRTLADLLDQPSDAVDRWLPDVAKVHVDDSAAAAAGIRRLAGRYLVLYTDLPADEATDGLPAAFDQAVGQWSDYFGVEPAKTADWQMTGFLIRDPERFRRLGLLPDDLPPFQHGYCRNTDLWVYEQGSDYYSRHLVLHEGVHGFMNAMLGACGPPWFMEGLAELLATHRLSDGRLTMNHVPRDRDEAPLWGRIKLVKDAIAAGRGQSLRQVVDTRFDAFLQKEPYAWSWVAALFLDRHPRWSERFRRLSKDVLRPDFNRRFIKKVGDDWPSLEQQWQVFLADLEYGCDAAAVVIDTTPGKPIEPAGAKIDVSAQRGWQNSGLRVEQGKKYVLRADGRYQVADEPKPWWCEPGGVTMHYYRGRPLGMLLAAVLPEDDQPPKPLEPITVGRGMNLAPPRSGTLFFKINESSGQWGDNAGRLSVEIRPE